MIYILDTNVISALRRRDRAPQVAAWIGSVADNDLYLSVITLGEIARGIHLQDRQNPAFAADLRAWLDRTTALFADRLLDFTPADARAWGALSAQLGHPGADLMIAAQALTRDATVVTGNTSDFAPTGVALIDPFNRSRRSPG